MFDTFRNRMQVHGVTSGEFRRNTAQMIMDTSWMRDPATLPVYVQWLDKGLPDEQELGDPLYAKYNVKSYHNITGDEVAYLLQFRKDDLLANENIKVGSYVYIPDEYGVYHWWLIWHYDDRPQFRQFSIVKCSVIYRWVVAENGVRRVKECLGAPRNQSSYNSGVWLDYYIQVVENQSIMFLPTNEDTRTITYDTRFLLMDPKRYPPLAYKVSKVQPMFHGDVTRFTMTQEFFNADRDNAELMIADYYDANHNAPDEEIIDVVAQTAIITFSGDPVIRSGGGFKAFTLKLVRYGQQEDVPEDAEIAWVCDIGEEYAGKFEIKTAGGTFYIKSTSYDTVGMTIPLSATIGDETATINIEVIAQ